MAYIGKSPTAAPLTSSDVADGIITNAKLAQDIISADTALGAEPADTDEFLVSDAGVLKRMDYSHIKASGGVAEADQWRLTTTTNEGSNAVVSSNWERVDTDGGDKMGTGLTQSSGVFSFPSTGFWLINMGASLHLDGGDNIAEVQIHTTLDNSSYNVASIATTGDTASTDFYEGCYCQFLFDVTNTTNCKFAIYTSSFNSSTFLRGATDANYTYITAIKLGDT